MKTKIIFYFIIALLVILNAYLLAHPNLIGRIGVILYKYTYIRTFPRALLTISLVIGVCILIVETIHFLVMKGRLRRTSGLWMLIGLALLSAGMLAKTVIDFTSWTYRHTGSGFVAGAHLLPILMTVVAIFGCITLPTSRILIKPLAPDADEN